MQVNNRLINEIRGILISLKNELSSDKFNL